MTGEVVIRPSTGNFHRSSCEDGPITSVWPARPAQRPRRGQGASSCDPWPQFARTTGAPPAPELDDADAVLALDDAVAVAPEPPSPRGWTAPKSTPATRPQLVT